jgi:hypothetical protein
MSETTVRSSSSSRHSSKRSSSSRTVNIVARTLAGSEYKVQVSTKCTVRELKQKLCEQAKGFNVDEMRLLKGPVTLDDDYKTLSEVCYFQWYRVGFQNSGLACFAPTCGQIKMIRALDKEGSLTATLCLFFHILADCHS